MKFDDDSNKEREVDSPAGSSDDKGTVLELPGVQPSEEPIAHPEPTLSQILAHARLLLSWEKDRDAFLKERRALMNPQQFVL